MIDSSSSAISNFRLAIVFLAFTLCQALVAAGCPTPCLSGNLVEVRMIDPSIVVDLPYATIYNFTGKKLYPEALCFVHEDTARALLAVQRDLAPHGYGLKVWDGYRPLSLESEMKEAPLEDRFVNHPKQSDRHARGTAVSVTLVDAQGFEVTMPTPFDIITDKTHRDYHALSEEIIFHRALLEQAMERHGLIGYARLWWHFDLQDYEKYPVLEIPLSQLVDEYHQLPAPQPKKS